MLSTLRKFIVSLRPIDPKSNVILTGLPRSGTTLACFLLSQVKNTIALNEPIKFAKCRSKKEIVQRTVQHIKRTRAELIVDGSTTVKARDGKVVSNHFEEVSKGGHRKKLIRRQQVKFTKPLDNDFGLVVKHNAAFTLCLSELSELFDCYAIIRNPLAVLGSWNSVQIPISKGRLRKNIHELIIPPPWTEDPGLDDRQLILLDWYFKQYKQLPRSRVLKYEEIIESNGQILEKLAFNNRIEPSNLESRNKNKSYKSEHMLRLGEKLSTMDNACWEFYEKKDVMDVLNQL